MTEQRYTADYIASLDDLPDGECFDPADVKYTTIHGSDLAALIRKAQRADIGGECYCVCREEYREICAGDGIYDWQSVSSIDPFTGHETWHD